jgi:hypothetical protein
MERGLQELRGKGTRQAGSEIEDENKCSMEWEEMPEVRGMIWEVGGGKERSQVWGGRCQVGKERSQVAGVGCEVGRERSEVAGTRV